MKKIYFLNIVILFLLCCGEVVLRAQATNADKHTISGSVKDAETGETLLGATVYAKELMKGTTSNDYGFYSLTLPASGQNITLVYSFVGYNSQEKQVVLNQSHNINIELAPLETILDDVVIKAESFKEELKSTQMSVDKITMKEAKSLPALFGEVDIIKTLQLKPGVQSGGEGFAGVYVRGGGPDQNLVLLDEAVVYNPNHLFGFFSTFNSDAVKDVKLYKGGFPAEYGGRLSSVIDVKLNDGNQKKFSGAGGLGLISSRLTLEGPIVKDRSSFIVSGRRTYADIFTRMINRNNEKKVTNGEIKEDDYTPIPDYYFYDLNTKINYQLNDKNRLFASGYFGRDVFGFSGDDFSFDFDWGNISTTARWNHVYNPKLFSNTTFTFSDYNYLIKTGFDIFEFEIGSGIRDINVKHDFYHLPNNRHTLKYGVNATYHDFEIGRLKFGGSDSTLFSTDIGQDATELGIYASDDFEVNQKLKLNYGLRLSGFLNDKKFYWGWEPRLAANYRLNKNVSIKGSASKMYQYLHLVSNSGASLPIDVWYPSNAVVKPQQAYQLAGGINWLIGEQFLLTNEIYYKWLINQIDFKDGADLFINPELDDEFVFGKGWGYGNEIFLEKKEGNLTGWVGYTLSWTWRQFEDLTGRERNAINEGEKFPPRYDRRHDVSVVAMYDISKRFTLTGTWVYGTGNAVSLPVGRFFFQDIESTYPDFSENIVPVYTKRNSFRMPAYHRLDLGLVFNMYPKWGESNLTLSVYNAYNRRNAFFIYYDIVEDEQGIPLRLEAKQVALFPIIPSLTWNFKF